MGIPKSQLTITLTARYDEQADRMVRKYHYLKRWPGTTVAAFRLNLKGEGVGVLVYSLPPKEIFKRYSVLLAWELSRLWISDELPRNTETYFIARTIHWIERNRPDVKLLISYADPTNVGTIYKAANWKSDGRTDDERKTPRFDLISQGKKYGRASHVPDGQATKRLPRASKYRYFYRLKPKNRYGFAENSKGQQLLFGSLTRVKA